MYYKGMVGMKFLDAVAAAEVDFLAAAGEKNLIAPLDTKGLKAGLLGLRNCYISLPVYNKSIKLLLYSR